MDERTFFRHLPVSVIPLSATGFDAHAFERETSEKPLKLCGVIIPSHPALEGHSDADVALHALTDALLGLVAADDLGSHFPDFLTRWKGASSALFIKKALTLLHQEKVHLCHADITLICETPKIAPHRLILREKLHEILGLPMGRISLKATTTEQMGFTGRKEGIAALATVSALLDLCPS